MNTSKTNWARIDAMTDEEIDTSDIPPLPDEFFVKAKLRMPNLYLIEKAHKSRLFFAETD